MTTDNDKFLVELDCPCDVWDALKYIAKEKLMHDCKQLVSEGGATRQDITAYLSRAIPDMHMWMRAQHAFITEAMNASTTKH